MKILLGILLILGGVVFAVWLGIWVMLVGGIMQAIDNWGVDTSRVVWGIIRAVFFEVAFVSIWIGVLPGLVLIGSGLNKSPRR